MKEISIYELLNLIKEGKQPNKIKYFGNIYEWEEDWYMTKEKNYKVCLGGKKGDGNQLVNAFNENVEIIEEDKEDIFNGIKWFADGKCFMSLSSEPLKTKDIEVDKEIEEINFITEHDSFSTIDQYKLQETINELIKAVNELKKGK